MADAPVIWWARRDLRLDDNPALTAALQTGRPVIPVFVWAPEEEGQFQQGRYSRWWTKHTVVLFQQVLEQMGSRLIIRRAAETSRGLMQVVNDTGAKAVFFNHLYDPISLVRDHEVKNALSKLGIECKSYNADLLYEPWDVLDNSDQPFTSFATFWNRVLEMPTPPPFPLPAPQQLPVVDTELFSVDVQQVDWFMTPEQEASSEQLKFKWQPGVEGAVEKVEAFLSAQLPLFEHDRAKVDRHSTSQLSPWVHTGTISVRYIFYRVCQRQAELRLAGQDISSSCKDFLQQLGYREYSRYLSFHFPFIHERALLAHLRACPWRMDQQHFKAWRQGQTGYPLVDAAMRELWSTGWCHNRMRVVASSFMVKNLLLPWQWGLKHFWDAQMDADLECDALGWQYVSGGMSDAHPFNYIIDLEQEARRFDPDGEYVRRWLPVLSRLPTKYIHSPWAAPPEVLVAADVELGFNYPERVITIEEARDNMAYACKVLESCASTSSGKALSHPYRPATQLPSGQQGGVKGPSGGGSRPSQANGTGTRYEAGDGAGSGQPQQPPQQQHRARAKQPAVPAGFQAYPPYPGLAGGLVDEGASALQGGARCKAERVKERAAARERRRTAAAEWAAYHNPEDVDAGEEVNAAGKQGPAEEEMDTAASYSDDEASDAAMSEEVVSNTVGLSAPQATACSVLPEPDEEGEAASAPRALHTQPTIRAQSMPEDERNLPQTQSIAQRVCSASLKPQQLQDVAMTPAGASEAGENQRVVRFDTAAARAHLARAHHLQAPLTGSDHGTQTPVVLSLQTGSPSGPSSGLDAGQGVWRVQRQSPAGAAVPPSKLQAGHRQAGAKEVEERRHTLKRQHSAEEELPVVNMQE